MILGDLHADCSNLSKTNKAKLKLVTDTSYHWLIPDDADTVTSSTKCAYDRFIARGNALRDKISDVRIFDIEKSYNLTAADVSILLNV